MVERHPQRADPAPRASIDRGQALARFRIADVVFRATHRVPAFAVLVILGGVIVSLVYGSMPAFRVRFRILHSSSGTR